MALGQDGQVSDAEDESARTVLVAGAANLLIAVAKLVAGVASGSSAMLAEGAHSVGDTINQAFLLTALRRSQRPPDAEHPFGHGMARYFWALLAAVGSSCWAPGSRRTRASKRSCTPVRRARRSGRWWCWRWPSSSRGRRSLRAVRQLRREAAEAGRSASSHLRTEAEPALRAVVWEDGVALVGLVLAAGGLLLDEATGSHVWDAVASLAIAALLVVVAYGLGARTPRT